jgi:methionyl-tRNA formyltransferase
MRIVLFTLNENRYTPLLLEPVLRRYESQIVAAYVSNRLNRLALIQWKRLWFFTRHLYPLSIQPGDLYSFLFQPRQPAVPMLTRLRERGIPAEYIDEIRSLRTRERLAAHDADLFLFCPFDRIAGPKFLSIPRLGTFNTHLGKLPEYRGAFGAFWVLRYGDKEAGAAFHRAIPEVDAGELVSEVRFPVTTSSMEQLMLDTIERAGPMVVEGLAKLESGTYTPIDVRLRPAGYHMLPTRRDLRAFYRQGCRLISLVAGFSPLLGSIARS